MDKLKKMKKIITGVILILLIIPSVQAFDGSLKIFADDQYGYKVSYPASWKASIYRSGIVVANINSADDKSGLQIRISDSQKDMSKFLDNYITDFKSSMNASLIARTRLTAGNMQGCALTFQSNKNEKRYLFKSYILSASAGGKMYIFQAGTPWGMKDQVEPILDFIAGSFRLEPVSE